MLRRGMFPVCNGPAEFPWVSLTERWEEGPLVSRLFCYLRQPHLSPPTGRSQEKNMDFVGFWQRLIVGTAGPVELR